MTNDVEVDAENGGRDVTRRLDEATRVVDDTNDDDGDDDVASFRRAVRIAFLARHLGVRGWEILQRYRTPS